MTYSVAAVTGATIVDRAGPCGKPYVGAVRTWRTFRAELVGHALAGRTSDVGVEERGQVDLLDAFLVAAAVDKPSPADCDELEPPGPQGLAGLEGNRVGSDDRIEQADPV